MKVLSAHVVTKSQTEDSKHLLIMPASAVHMNMGFSQLKHTYDSKLTSSSPTDNINRKRWRSLLKRVQKKQMDPGDATHLQRKSLFGRALSDVCEKDGCPPKPIMEVLLVLCRKGLHTEGVFRKAGNARTLKEIKEQLNNGVDVDLKNQHVILLADLLKHFLRHLPGSLLMVDRYQAWITAIQKQDFHEKCTAVQLVINTLPEPNMILLKHLIVLLHHISVNKDRNKMESNNLAVCVSPNLLLTDNIEMIRNVSNLTQFLIDNCGEIFGEDSLTLLGDPEEEEFSDSHDSVLSLHHDSAYDSNDPDADGAGSSTEIHTFHSDTEEKSLVRFHLASSCDAMGKQTSKPFIRRCSEPTIVFNKSARNQTALTRSHTDMDFYGHHLTKQISDECALFEVSKRLLPVDKGVYTSSPNEHLRYASQDCSCCSSSSLESTFSSASESSIQTPIISSSKLSFLKCSKAHSTVLGEATKKRSQSMKAPNSRTKISFSRGGVGKRGQKILRHSQTLPEILPLKTTLPMSQKPRRVSSEEVFQQVDSRILGNPPSYEQAIKDNTHSVLSLSSPLTVDAARHLSRHTSSQSTFPTAEPSNSCSVKHGSCWGGERSDVSAVPSTPTELQQGSLSKNKSEECNSGIWQCCNQQLLGILDVRESYV